MRTQSILIVSASTGTGHLRAGEAAREAMALRWPDARVEHVDLLAIAPSWVRSAYGGGYELMATRAPWLWHHVYRQTDGDGWDKARWSSLARKLLFREFQQLLSSERWDLCLSTHFLPCQLAAGKGGLPPMALAITDFTLHRYWVQPGVRDYFVATAGVAAELRDRMPKANVHTTGIPISPRFAAAPNRVEARSLLGIAARCRTILLMGGGLGLGVEEMTRAALEGAPDSVQLVAICGKNREAAAALTALHLPRERLRIEGYVGGVERYLAAADVVVTKPGGLTISEALALGKPLILTRPIPGQETGNTRAVVGAGAALLADDDAELQRCVSRVMTDDRLLSGLGAAARRLGRPDAATDLVSILAEPRAKEALRAG